MFIYNFYIHQHTIDVPYAVFRIFTQTWIINFPSVIFSIPLFLIALSYTKQESFHWFVQLVAEASMGIYCFHSTECHLWHWLNHTSQILKNLNGHWIHVLKWTFKIYSTGLIIDLVRQKLFGLFLFKRKYYQAFTKCFDSFITGTNI